MHGHWFNSLGQQEHAFVGSAFYFIHIIWLTYVFANTLGWPSGFSLQDAA